MWDAPDARTVERMNGLTGSFSSSMGTLPQKCGINKDGDKMLRRIVKIEEMMTRKVPMVKRLVTKNIDRKY